MALKKMDFGGRVCPCSGPSGKCRKKIERLVQQTAPPPSSRITSFQHQWGHQSGFWLGAKHPESALVAPYAEKKIELPIPILGKKAKTFFFLEMFSTKIYPQKILLLIFCGKNCPPPLSQIKRYFGYANHSAKNFWHQAWGLKNISCRICCYLLFQVKVKFANAQITITDDGSNFCWTIWCWEACWCHYYAIAFKEVLKKPHELNVRADSFEKQFGLGWQDAMNPYAEKMKITYLEHVPVTHAKTKFWYLTKPWRLFSFSTAPPPPPSRHCHHCRSAETCFLEGNNWIDRH